MRHENLSAEDRPGGAGQESGVDAGRCAKALGDDANFDGTPGVFDPDFRVICPVRQGMSNRAVDPGRARDADGTGCGMGRVATARGEVA